MLGENDITKDPDCDNCPGNITRIASEIIVHEDYKGQSDLYKNDIALIRLDKPVPLYRSKMNFDIIIFQ